MRRQNIAEITGRHGKIHLLAQHEARPVRHAQVSPVIIDDLRDQPADIDRIGRGPDIARLPHLHRFFGIGEDRLDRALRVVEIALHRDHSGIIALLRDHLQTLDIAHALLRIENDDPHARNIGKAFERGLARIARSRRQDHNLLADPLLAGRRRHQVRQDRERHILKSERPPVIEFQHMPVPGMHQRRDRGIIKFAVISPDDAVHQLLPRIIREEKLHDFVGQLLITHLLQFMQAPVHAWEILRHIESPVRRDAADDRRRGAHSLRAPPRTDISNLSHSAVPFSASRSCFSR